MPADLPRPLVPPPRDDPSNRLPWIALGLGLVVIVAAATVFVVAQQQRAPAIAEPTATLAAGVRLATAGPPPTLAAPSSAPATATPRPTPTRVPVVSPPPGATLLPAETAAAPTSVNPPAPAPPAPAPVPPAATTAPAAPPTVAPPTLGQTPAPSTPATRPAATPLPAAPTASDATATLLPPASARATLSPTPFSVQVSAPGGLANTRQDLDGALGRPLGETPGKLVVYRRDTTEYHVEFSPEPSRATLVAELLPADKPLALDAAVQASRTLLPRDTQPRSTGPEGNERFVVERFSSPTLARALPAGVFQQRQGQPGDLLVVYLKNAQGQIVRVVVGVGNDPGALLDRAGQ